MHDRRTTSIAIPKAGGSGPYGFLIPPHYLRCGGEITVTDALMVVLMVGFFVLAGLFVAWLDRV